MREITCQAISDLVERLCVEAATVLPDDLCRTILEAKETETSPVGQGILQDIADNFTLAREKGVPICQDTGMAVVFLEIGQEVHITGGSLRDAVDLGVHNGYLNGALRCSVVEDPLRRVNTGDNTPAVLHVELVEGDAFRVTIAPKGFGSENMSAMKMFTPAATREDVEDWIAACVDTAGSNPCPPVIVGVGIGGTIEQCALEAKRLCFRPWTRRIRTPITRTWRKRPWKRSIAWASAPRAWAAGSRPWAFISGPIPPTSRDCPAW